MSLTPPGPTSRGAPCRPPATRQASGGTIEPRPAAVQVAITASAGAHVRSGPGIWRPGYDTRARPDVTWRADFAVLRGA